MTQPAVPTRTPRRSIWFLLALGALLITPASASATAAQVEMLAGDSMGTIFVGGTNLIKDPNPHVINVSYGDGAIFVSDSAGAVPFDRNGGPPSCAQVSPTVVSCTPPAGKVVDRVDVYASGMADTITATSLGPNVTTAAIDGNQGNDKITTGPTKDEIRADEGDDLIDAGLGADSILGMAGIDTATYASRTEGVFVSIGNESTAGEDTVSTENVIGGSGDDIIIGAAKSAPLDDEKSDPRGTYTGGPGNDRLTGGAGADRLDGAGGQDRLSGGDGADKLKGGAGRDRCSGGKQKDRARQCEREASIP